MSPPQIMLFFHHQHQHLHHPRPASSFTAVFLCLHRLSIFLEPFSRSRLFDFASSSTAAFYFPSSTSTRQTVRRRFQYLFCSSRASFPLRSSVSFLNTLLLSFSSSQQAMGRVRDRQKILLSGDHQLTSIRAATTRLTDFRESSIIILSYQETISNNI